MFESLREMDRRQWSATLAAFAGWSLDAFDFFLMVFMFQAIAHEFHASVPAVTAASAVTLAARPFGAFFFGQLADRYGRRPVLIAVILLYSAFELASAFAPSLAVLLVLRAFFGFSMGGEWGVGASLAMETIPAKARGFVSGFLQQGYAVGYLLAALVFFLLFDKIGWRGMFIVGVAPALVSILIFLHVEESPSFEAARHTRAPGHHRHVWALGAFALLVALAPATLSIVTGLNVTTLIYAICAPVGLAGLWVFRSHWRIALYLTVMMTAFNLFSHGTQDLYPTFLKSRGFGTGQVGMATAIGNVGAICGGILMGAWSERLGRRWAMIVAAAVSIVLIPLWAFSPTLVLLAAGAFVMGAAVQGTWGVVPAHLNELAPSDARGAFPGYVYQMGNLLASGLIVGQATLAKAHGGDYSFALAITAGVVAVLIIVIVLFGPERRGADLTVEQG
ncbi:MAG TPA: MFS transporter [Caulobacteraceae bacterium]|jgi:SHS family lactate transporter-like MFS transporter|nr:MFS transporter [Caulobacteraceae bacterium]